MKKTVFLILMLGISGMVYSQKVFMPETYFGIKGGWNTSGIISDPVINLDINPGFTGGIVFSHISQNSLGIQIELNYNQGGWKEILDTTNTYKRQLNYIQLPILTHVNIGKKNTRALINFGPYVSYLLSEDEKIELLEGVVPKDYYQNQVANTIDFGMCFGVGVSQNTAVGLFQFETRVTFGLSNLFSTNSDLSLSTSRNIIAEATLSYLVDYKKVKSRVGQILNKGDNSN